MCVCGANLGGCAALAESLAARACGSLNTLRLSKCAISASNCGLLLRCLQDHPSLLELNLGSNNVAGSSTARLYPPIAPTAPVARSPVSTPHCPYS